MIERLSAVAAIAVRHAGAYTELIRSDLDAASTALRRRAIAASVMAGASVFAVAIGCVWVIAAAWDTAARHWAIGGLLGLFLVIAAAALWKFRALGAAAPGVLPQTAREWSKDRQMLEELFERERARAS
jgi:uncharacterized membrane protein YqjE